MKLRQKSKRDQTLDAVASMAKTWSEWRLGEKVTKTAAKGAKKATKTAQSAKKKKSSSDTAKRKPLKVAGAIALIGAIGAAVAKKITGGKAEPLYTPPGPAADMAEPPPSPVAVEDLTQDSPNAATTPAEPAVEPADSGPTETPPRDPSAVVVDDVDADAPAEGTTDAGGGGGEAPAAPLEGDSTADVAPEPEDLISDTASEPEADKDAGETTVDAGGASDDAPTDRPG